MSSYRKALCMLLLLFFHALAEEDSLCMQSDDDAALHLLQKHAAAINRSRNKDASSQKRSDIEYSALSEASQDVLAMSLLAIHSEEVSRLVDMYKSTNPNSTLLMIAVLACIVFIALYNILQCIAGVEGDEVSRRASVMELSQDSALLSLSVPFFMLSLVLSCYAAYAGIVGATCIYGPLATFLMLKAIFFWVTWVFEIIAVKGYEVEEEDKVACVQKRISILGIPDTTPTGSASRRNSPLPGQDEEEEEKTLPTPLKRMLQSQQVLFFISIVLTVLGVVVCTDAVGVGGFFSSVVPPMAGTPCGASAINAMAYYLCLWVIFIIVAAYDAIVNGKHTAWAGFLKIGHLLAL